MKNSPFIVVDGMSFLNLPCAKEVIEKVVAEDCYELRSLDKDWILIDCGAFYGEASIFAANLGMKVIALEPSGDSFRILEANWETNKMVLDGFVQLVNRPVGINGKYFIHHYRYDHPAGSGMEPFEGAIKKTMTAIGMHELVKMAKNRFSVVKPIAVKMDIEHGEKDAFHDCDIWLPKVDFVAMETHNFDSDIYSEALVRNGFDVKLTGTGHPPRVPWDKSMAGGIIIARKKKTKAVA